MMSIEKFFTGVQYVTAVYSNSGISGGEMPFCIVK
jgi:hypothetical protein